MQKYHEEIRCKYLRYGQHNTTKYNVRKVKSVCVCCIRKCMRFYYMAVLFTLVNFTLDRK